MYVPFQEIEATESNLLSRDDRLRTSERQVCHLISCFTHSAIFKHFSLFANSAFANAYLFAFSKIINNEVTLYVGLISFQCYRVAVVYWLLLVVYY